VYLLIIILHYTVGITEPVVLNGKEPLALETCKDQGIKAANWLTQDFVRVTWECRPVQ